MSYRTSSSARRRLLTGGFTLLELLVVIVIAGIMLGMVSFNAIPGDRQMLQNEAQRVALLLQLARDEAIVRNRQVAFEADSERYRFLVREDNGWKPITDDDLLREREFKHAIALSINPPLSEGGQGFRIVFGREPVDKPFVLTLSAGEASIAIRADGVGHYVVE
ncbi:MAG: GspH/FimT family pseudopilin [Burkholderiaceae bacterium]